MTGAFDRFSIKPIFQSLRRVEVGTVAMYDEYIELMQLDGLSQKY